MHLLRHSVSAVLLAGLVLAAGCGGDSAGDSGATRSYDVELRIDDSQDDYRYVAVGDIPDFTVGDEVTFVVENTGTLNHDLQVQAPDGDVVAVAPAVAPGDTLETTALLGQVGVYRLNCLVDNHLTEHSMQTLIEVAPAES
jgi:plastocyanin